MTKNYQIRHCDSVLIGRNISTRRRALNMPRHELSAAIGYKDKGQFIRRIEQYGAPLPAHYLPAIAQKLRVKDLHDFFVPNRFLELGD